MCKFKIKVFGTLGITGPDGTRIPVAGNKQQALLSYLALNPENPPARDQIMGLLWGDRFNDQARQSLRQGTSKLRQMFSHDDRCAIWAENDRIGLDLDFVSIDLSEFTKLIRKNTPETDEKALALFQSSLLDGLTVRETAFEEWLSQERTRVNEMAIPVFERLASHLLRSGDQQNSQQIARQLVNIDPLREASHRLLMKILAQSGQRAEAIKQYQLCEDILMRELDVKPDAQSQQLLNEIKSPAPAPMPENLEHIPRSDKALPHDQMLTQKVRVSILPTLQVGDDVHLDAFTIGLSEDLTTALTKFRWIDVIAQAPIDGGTPSTALLRQAAAEQKVIYSVESSVRQLGNQLRITAQLVDLQSGKYIWVKRYHRDTTDLFALLDDITKTIAAALETEIVASEGAKARSKSSDQLSAWDCYHLGLSAQYEFSAKGNERAQSLFRRAIELDPKFADAYSRLSYAMVLSAIYFEADQNSGLLDEALELSRKAVRYDDQDAVARFSLGRVHLARGEYEASILELEHAIDLNPSLAQAHCGLGDSLAYLGRAEDAIENFEEAVRLSPQDPHRWAFSMYAAMASIFSGDFERAIEWAQSSIRVPNSHYWANAALVSALGHLERFEEAQLALKELMILKPDFSCAFTRDRLFYLKDQSQIDCYVEGLKKAGCT